VAAQEDKSLGGEATFAGKAAVRPQHAAVSLGGEQTIGGDHATQETVIDDIEVVDLESRYKVEGTLGQGGMGAVLLATDTRLGRRVAIKRILGEAARSKTAITRFLTEAKAIAALNHPNIVQIYDYGRAKDGPFLIMELVDGGSLLDACESGPLPLQKAVDIVCQICEGLGAAHEQGIVHRDIKPANILLNRTGLPKLTDFGLAKAENHDHGMTMAGAVMGTPDFMPPEQRRDASLVDHRSDLWSLAATLYQMVTGRSPKIIRLKDVPTALQPVLEKALEDAQDQRYQSAADLRDAILMAVGLGGGKAAIQQGNLVEGQCPSCGTVNTDVGRKYCRQCQGALRTPCLQCDKDMPVWDAVCGECGGRQSDVADTRQAALVKQQQQAKDAYKRYEFADAVAIGEQLASLRHPTLVKFAEWGRAFVTAANEQQSRLAASSAERLAEARSHRQAFDYAAAIRALESVPSRARDSEVLALLKECRSSRDESEKLLKAISERIKTKDIDGLSSLVEQAITLLGDRADLQRLREQLLSREAKRRKARERPAKEHPTPTSEKILESTAAAVIRPRHGLNPRAHWPAIERRRWLIAACGIVAAFLVSGWYLYSQPPKPVAVTERSSTPLPRPRPKPVAPSGQQVGNGEAQLGINYESLPEVNAQWLKVRSGGIMINYVEPGTAAEEAGLTAGDVLVKFDNNLIACPADFEAIGLPSMEIGSSHSATIVREGRELSVDVALKQRSETTTEAVQLHFNELSRVTVEGLIQQIRLAGSRLCCSTYDHAGVWNYSRADSPAVIWTNGVAVDLTADGATAVVGEKFGGLATWNASSGQKKLVLAENGDEELQGCRIDGSGQRIATVHDKGMLRIWDAETGKRIDEVKLSQEAAEQGLEIFGSRYDLAPFSPSGDYLMLSTATDLFVWNIVNRTIDWSWESDVAIKSFAPSFDWSQCAVATESGAIKILLLQDASVVATLRGHTKPAEGLAWHGNDWLASASRDDFTVRVWNVGERNVVWQFDVGETRAWTIGPYAVCFEPEQPRLWTGLGALRQFSIPPLTKKSWQVATPRVEAVDFASMIKENPIAISSSMTGSYTGGRVTTTYSFSDNSSATGEKPAEGKPWQLQFTDTDGKTRLDGACGFSLDANCLVTNVVPKSSAAAAGIKNSDAVLACGKAMKGPFFRVPNGNDESDQILRQRILAGPANSTAWLRVKDGSGKVRTVSVTRDQLP
jgi:serine/threonine protein kinase/WD40 repeat protein